MSVAMTSANRLRTILVAAVIVALLVFAVAQFTTAQKLVTVLENADWAILIPCAALHVVFFSLYAWMYHYGFEAIGAPTSSRALLPVVFAAMFAKTIVPIEGAGFAAVLVADSARRGRSTATAAAVILLVTAVDLATALPFVIVGVSWLRANRADAPYDYLVAALFAAFVGVYLGLFWLGGVHREQLRRVLSLLVRLVDRLSELVAHIDVLSEGWADRNAAEFADAWRAATSSPRSVVRLAAVSIALHLANIAGLWLIFAAFGRTAEPALLVTTYALSAAFYVVSITPQGVGQVEAGTALVISSLGVPAQLAIAVTLVYRVMNVWLPAAIGLVTAGRLASTRPAD